MVPRVLCAIQHNARVHTTTVRFSGETWRDLKAVCEREGIATAQYIREATIARMARSHESEATRALRAELADLRARVERAEWRRANR